MSNRTDPRLIATARLVENLAELLPTLRAHIAVELHQLDSIPDHTPGAIDPTPDAPSATRAGRCTVESVSPDNPDQVIVCKRLRPCPEHDKCTANVIDPLSDDAELIDCGRRRPCPEHDHPVTLTPVERAADQRRQLTNDLESIEDDAKIIALRAHSALRAARRLLGARVELTKPSECRDGQAGKDGAIEWGRPECRDPAVKMGLCAREFQAYYRWRKRNGVKTERMFEEAG